MTVAAKAASLRDKAALFGAKIRRHLTLHLSDIKEMLKFKQNVADLTQFFEYQDGLCLLTCKQGVATDSGTETCQYEYRKSLLFLK